MKVRYTATARAELHAILAEITGDNPAAADAVAASIKAAIDRLYSFPRIGALTDVKGIFMKITRPYRYLIFYSLDDNSVVVRNIRHPARRRPSDR